MFFFIYRGRKNDPKIFSKNVSTRDYPKRNVRNKPKSLCFFGAVLSYPTFYQ